jgi:hypothetical protein
MSENSENRVYPIYKGISIGMFARTLFSDTPKSGIGEIFCPFRKKLRERLVYDSFSSTYWFVVLGGPWDKYIRRDGALEMNSGSADGVPELDVRGMMVKSKTCFTLWL